MKYGLENYSIFPALSVLVSIILILGFYRIGKLIFNFTFLKSIIKNISILNYQYISVSLLFFSLILYPIVLFIKTNNNVFYVFSLVILFFGVWHVLKKILVLINFINRTVWLPKNIYEIILTLFIFFYFLLSIGPITDADSLDYHLSVPIYVINHGLFPNDILWFHSSQAGLGEIPIIFGLVVGAEQFSGLIQYSGLISVLGVLKHKINKLQKNKYSTKEFYLILMFLSIPVLIYLNSTAKPQLIFIGYNILAFTIAFYDIKNEDKKITFFKYFLILLLIYASFEGKFSFILSGFIIWIVSSFKVLKQGNYKLFILTNLFILILAFPSFYWKYVNYNGNFINKIYFPLFSSLEGYAQLYKSINACEFPCNKSFFLFPNSLGRYTESLGIAIISLIFLFFKSIKKNILIIFSVLFYFYIAYFYGKFSARFLIEPIIWSIIAVKYSNLNFNFKFSGILKLYIILQSIITFSALLVGIITISIGSTTPTVKNFVLNNSAYGYDLSKWVNSNLDDSNKVLYTHRSISLPTVNVISTDFLSYTDKKIYFELLKQKKPEFLVLQSNSSEKHKKLISCTKGIYKKKENFFKHSSRNFFNKSKSKYSAYIYYFDYLKLPDCYYE